MLLEAVRERTLSEYASVAMLAKAGISELRILDTDAHSAINSFLRPLPGYVFSSYLPDQPWGTEIARNHLNINLEHIDLPSSSFDIILSSDVMEHVRDDESAHSEIFRVLKPGGVYLFNVPYDEAMSSNWRLVDTSGDEDVLLCEPHYHGDPVSGKVLAYRVFGREILDQLARIGFKVAFRRMNDPQHLVIDGDVFEARKPT